MCVHCVKHKILVGNRMKFFFFKSYMIKKIHIALTRIHMVSYKNCVRTHTVVDLVKKCYFHFVKMYTILVGSNVQ